MLNSSVEHARALTTLPTQVMGMVGSARKRMLMLWQAVEMSRAMDKPDQATLALARRALEPPADPTDIEPVDTDLVSRPPLASGVPRHWSIVRCGCIEGAPPFSRRLRIV